MGGNKTQKQKDLLLLAYMVTEIYEARGDGVFKSCLESYTDIEELKKQIENIYFETFLKQYKDDRGDHE